MTIKDEKGSDSRLDRICYSYNSMKIGNRVQLGGTRSYYLAEGNTQGTRCIDVDNGSGLRFTVVADRGMDLSLCSYKGINLVYHSPVGEVNPAYYDKDGLEWLRVFPGGLLVTCGLTYCWAPSQDGDTALGLHGRYSATPAQRVCDLTRYNIDGVEVELTGEVEEAALFQDRLRLTRKIETKTGQNSLKITDQIHNFGAKASPLMKLYHINFGYPLLDECSEIFISSSHVHPHDDYSAADIENISSFPQPDAKNTEKNYIHTMKRTQDGFAYAMLANPSLLNGLGVYIKFDPDHCPYLCEWKNAQPYDYVLGLEPSNTTPLSRANLRSQDKLPILKPGETIVHSLEIGILEGDALAHFMKTHFEEASHE